MKSSVFSKIKLRIDLGPSVVGNVAEAFQKKQQTPYLVKENTKRAQTTGAKPRDTSSLTMGGNKDQERKNVRKPEEEREKEAAESKKHNLTKVASKDKNPSRAPDQKPPKTILRNKDTPKSKSRVVINEIENKEYEKEEPKREILVFNRNTPAITLNTPLRGNPDSPLKPYKKRVVESSSVIKNSQNWFTTSAATTLSSRNEEIRKSIDIEARKKASKELYNAINVGTRMLEFKDMLQVKVTIGLEAHIPRNTLEKMNSFEKILDELTVLWKINRVDIDLLEHLLCKAGIYERFTPDLEKFKNTVRYNDLPASSEREVNTLISSLHNLLQGSGEASCNYTTMCFLHFGNVYSFNRARLSCMKSELASLLHIQTTQIIYLAKVAADSKAYLTVFQMPCSIIKKLFAYTKRNNDNLMSLGLKGVQITGSDGLRYTQSMSYLQEKVSVSTQTSSDEINVPSALSRNVKTSMSLSSLPPLTQQQMKLKFPDTPRPNTIAQETSPNQPFLLDARSFYEKWGNATPAPSPYKEDLSLLPQNHPDDEKFERRVNLLKSALTSLSQSDIDRLVNTLLEQIQSLHRQIANLKKDLKEKSRELHARQGFVQKAEKEIKTMEMRLETKAQQISEINQQLLKRIKQVMAENSRLKEMLQNLDAEVDIHRQMEKENRFGNSVRAVRLSRPVQQGVL